MVSRISTLPNFFNGKLYKHWDSVYSFLGEGSIIASKTNKKGEHVELLIQGDGKRELFSDTYKIMDLTGEDNIRRTYTYQRTPQGIEGKMFIENNNSKPQPLITAANWLIKNLIPQKINMTLNPSHPKARMLVEVDDREDSFNKFRKVDVKNITATKFSNSVYPRPSNIDLTLKDGSVLKTDNPAIGNVFVSNSKDSKAETHPLDYINVVV